MWRASERAGAFPRARAIACLFASAHNKHTDGPARGRAVSPLKMKWLDYCNNMVHCNVSLYRPSSTEYLKAFFLLFNLPHFWEDETGLVGAKISMVYPEGGIKFIHHFKSTVWFMTGNMIPFPNWGDNKQTRRERISRMWIRIILGSRCSPSPCNSGGRLWRWLASKFSMSGS